ncbi:hemolysin family protein [Mangrovibacillus cuniculi]|uniref:HlyC/CorC family transporter n=1 Tax=Mangrovibacillus cuniculi TaxID=2593652 RepID=A0A7S8CE94_9BACI|nr:hemolysin family protein [Mangrovibacillus cuniculi]QPC48311.1 HlyC/CorC family transporter [Mangrovibacillus cuniculi]
MIILNLFLVAVLIALTAFFVATEFAVVKVRGTRIEQLAEEGNKSALAAQKVLDNLDGYLSACQLGITITALGLGWLGEPTIERILHPVFEELAVPSSVSHILSFGIAFSLITFLHVVIGELAPKTVAIQKAEQVSLLLSRPLILFYKIMYPFIWALNGSARFLVGVFGIKSASEHEVAHSEEELRIILTESYEKGEINKSEFNYVNKIFEFDNRVAKEIMVPRTDMVVLDLHDPIEEVLETFKEEQFTRYPIVDGDKDLIVGMLNTKEIFTDYIHFTPNQIQTFILKKYVRPVLKVIETIPIHNLLMKMQKERKHLAVLIDEYGGTAGLVTVEDILEEIVGEIRDEFDQDEKPQIQKISSHQYILDGRVHISDVNELFNLTIDDSELDTIGGWILTKNIDIEVGETVVEDHTEFTVLEMDGRMIRSMEVSGR